MGLKKAIAVILLILDSLKYTVVLLLVGAIIGAALNLLITALGAGAVWKKKATLRWFIFILSAMSAIISALVAIIANHKNINEDWENQKTGKDSMHYTERAMECCGKNGPNDYINLNTTIPKSCFPTGYYNHKDRVYKIGCAQRWNEFRSNPIHLAVSFLAQSIHATLLGLLSSQCINRDVRISNSRNLQNIIYEAGLS